MTDLSFVPPAQSAMDARFDAQRIAFGPVVFHCVHYAWKRGLLQALAESGGGGRSVDELAASGRWSRYALQVVLESCCTAAVVSLVQDRYVLEKTGFFLLVDRITQVNFDFVHDVCYAGLGALTESLDRLRPCGLQALGDWPTVYAGLSELPEPARSSWFAFDHHYSDTSFPAILPFVFADAPRQVMDLGANTGRFSLAALSHEPEVHLHLVDLPGQLALAEATLAPSGLSARATLHPRDMLDPQAALPGGMDVVWMSQFLSCFSEEAIASILKRVRTALQPGGRVLILDTFWDRQQHPIAAYCLINTSPYFTAIASGNSKVYASTDYIRLAEQAGLKLTDCRDHIGYCHSLLQFGAND